MLVDVPHGRGLEGKCAPEGNEALVGVLNHSGDRDRPSATASDGIQRPLTVRCYKIREMSWRARNGITCRSRCGERRQPSRPRCQSFRETRIYTRQLAIGPRSTSTRVGRTRAISFQKRVCIRGSAVSGRLCTTTAPTFNPNTNSPSHPRTERLALSTKLRVRTSRRSVDLTARATPRL
jgi:hypothetical protein